jgi:hypothetical protein
MQWESILRVVCPRRIQPRRLFYGNLCYRREKIGERGWEREDRREGNRKGKRIVGQYWQRGRQRGCE